MKTSKLFILKNLHLLISLAIVIPFAFVYGLTPVRTLPQYFDFIVETTDLTNVFRGLMGLYLGISAVWIMGMVKPHLWEAATLLNIVFMMGLAIGRTISLVIDGIPSQPFVVALALELTIGIYGFIQWKKYAYTRTFKSLKAQHRGNIYKLEEDLPDIGWYLYQYDASGKCTHDTMQDNLAMGMEYAQEEFGVPMTKWN